MKYYLHHRALRNRPGPSCELSRLGTRAGYHPRNTCRKRPVIASYYGAMTGHDLLGSARLDLWGWSIKHADVIKIWTGITVDLWIGGDRFDSRQFNIPEQD